MDNVISAARSLGKMMQMDERYVRYNSAKEASDNDTELQEMIADFERTRSELSREIQSEDKDSHTIETLDKELKALYAQIMGRESMVEFSESKKDIDQLVSFVSQIITASTNGQDPETVEFQEACGGSCSSCSGCS